MVGFSVYEISRAGKSTETEDGGMGSNYLMGTGASF